MNFGASSFIWASPFSNKTLDLFEKAYKMGFDTFEICIEDPATIDTDSILKESKKYKLNLLVCGAFGPDRDITSTDSSIRKSGIEYIMECIDIAEKLNSPVVSGPMYAATGKTNLLSPEDKKQQWDWAIENLKIVAEYAEDKNVKLAIEPLNRFETDMINTVEQGLKLLNRVGKDNVGFLLDTFHMNIEEKNMAESIKKAGNKVFNFHACSNDRGTPGTGNIPWKDVVQALKAINYDGPIVIESFTTKIKEIARAVSLWRPIAESQDQLASDGVRFLRKVFK